MAFEAEMQNHAERVNRALAMGGPKKIAQLHARGKYSGRERIACLLDAGSFLEIGRFNHSDIPGMEDQTPADSKIGGYRTIDGRRVVVVANDFTVLTATSSRIAGRKEGELKLGAAEKGFPVIHLGEADGARMSDIMGSKGLASFGGERSNFGIPCRHWEPESS